MIIIVIANRNFGLVSVWFTVGWPKMNGLNEKWIDANNCDCLAVDVKLTHYGIQMINNLGYFDGKSIYTYNYFDDIDECETQSSPIWPSHTKKCIKFKTIFRNYPFQDRRDFPTRITTHRKWEKQLWMENQLISILTGWADVVVIRTW